MHFYLKLFHHLFFLIIFFDRNITSYCHLVTVYVFNLRRGCRHILRFMFHPDADET